jgi:hypothetical protein
LGMAVVAVWLMSFSPGLFLWCVRAALAGFLSIAAAE